MFLLVVGVSITRCQAKTGSGSLIHRAAAHFLGLFLAPMLFAGLHFMQILHSIGVPLPAWASLGVDLGLSYAVCC